MADWDYPQRIRDLLDPIGRQLGMEGAVEAGRLFARWRTIVGDDVAAHVEPTSLRDGVLRVRADSPAWATEIGYLATEIAERVNAEVGRPVVNELRVTAGPKLARPRSEGRASPRATTRPTASEAASIDPQEALERARRAWLARDRKTGSDQDF